MATNVLIIAEDWRYDQYILKPLIQALLARLGKGRAKVQMCRDPMLRGVSQVLTTDAIREVIEVNPLADLYLLIVDRDGEEGRGDQLEHVSDHGREHLRDRQQLLGEHAHQEVEVWLLAGHDDLPTSWNWNDVRAEPNPKELYYEPYAEQRGVSSQLGKGRKRLGDEAARRYDRVRQLCEEVAALEGGIEQWLDA